MLKRRAYNYLLEWKNKFNRKPILLRGARQVGKTSLVEQFGQQEFSNFISFNLDHAQDFRDLSQVYTIDDFEQLVAKRKQILNDQTLIFFDEIQNLPHLVKLLRFFYENNPKWAIIGSGSLLEVVLQTAKISMPVGRVEFLYLYPLDFFEFLIALGQERLLADIKNIKVGEQLPKITHQFALEFFLQYSWMGGMPEVVNTFIQTQDIQLLTAIYDGLLLTYQEDVYKYESTANSKYLQFVIQTAPRHAGQLITYEGFGRSKYRSREMSEAFNTLEKVMLLNQLQSTQSRSIPLLPKPLRSKKLLFLDAGLVNYQHQVGLAEFQKQQLEDVYKGRIAEQVVGQNLLAQTTFSKQDLFYWSRPAKEGSAEVDFCFNYQGKIVGVEVKSGESSRLRSLFSFAQLVENSILVRVYSGPLKQESISIAGESYPLLSVPFYLVPRLKELI